MKTILKIFYWLLGILALLVVISFLLPKTYKVERIIFIKAKPEVIYGFTSVFDRWHIWVAWTKELDSTAIFETIGGQGQVGTTWKWEGKKLGQGEMIATELVPGQLVAYDLAFNKGKYQSKGKIMIEQQGDSCKVSWLDEGDLGYNPIGRYMGLMMDRMMGPDFEKGLAKLKKVCELRKDWPQIDKIKIPAQVALIIKDSAGPDSYAQVMGKAYSEILTYVQRKNITLKGSPIAMYIRWDSATQFSVMEIGYPVDKVEKASGRIEVRNIPEQNGVRAIYFGPYSKTASVYLALDQYCKENSKTETSGPWEIYVTDPIMEKDSLKWETHIIYPVK